MTGNVQRALLAGVLLCVILLSATSEASAQVVVFREDGEGLTNGQPVPGWTICEGGCASVTAATAVKKVGNAGIRVNGDNFRRKPLPTTLTGPLDVSLWMFPATDSNTNYSFQLGPATNPGTVNIRINESNTWFLSPPGGCGPGSSIGGCGRNGFILGPFSKDWTLVRLFLNPAQETVDVFLNGVHVASGVSTLGPNGERLLSEGIGIIGTASGRGGAGHDSFFDDLVITSLSTGPVKQRNAMWLDFAWNSDTNASRIPELVSFLRRHSINTIYLNQGRLAPDGASIDVGVNAGANFRKVVKSLDSDIRIFAWINGKTVVDDDARHLKGCDAQAKEQLKISQSKTAKNIVSLLASNFTDFDGIHIDIEPVFSMSFIPERLRRDKWQCVLSSRKILDIYGNTHFWDFWRLVRDVRRQIAHRSLSVATPLWIEGGQAGFNGSWLSLDFQAIARVSDHLATTQYQIPEVSGEPRHSSFREYISTALARIMIATAPTEPVNKNETAGS